MVVLILIRISCKHFEKEGKDGDTEPKQKRLILDT